MQVDDTRSASGEARLDKVIILLQVRVVHGPAERVVREELPSDGQAEHIEAVVVHEVLHLPRAVHAVVLGKRRPRR